MIASRETVLSLLYRIGTIGLSFVSVSLLIRNLGPERYGAWATLVSALVWIQMSDLGIGYVIKNRVAARHDMRVLCDQIATAVRLALLIGLVLIALYFVAGSRLSVVRDFPIEAGLLYVSAFLCLPAMIGVNILQGLNRATVSFQAALFQNLLWFILNLTLGRDASLRDLAVTFAALWLLNGAYTFYRGYRALDLGQHGFAPRLLGRQASGDAMPLLRIGGAFFLLQLTGLVLFNLGTYLAYTYYSATAAARFDILNKVYQIPMTLFNVLIAIAWSTIATLISKRQAADMARLQAQLVAASLGSGVLLLLVSIAVVPPFVRFYSHGQLEAHPVEVFWFAAQVATQMVAYAGAVFMNAAERLRIQIGFAVTSTALFLPLFFMLRSHAIGIAAIPMATLIVVLPGALYFNYYAHRHIIAPLSTP
jgi:O-antigen/teichoic acid export membrane protein